MPRQIRASTRPSRTSRLLMGLLSLISIATARPASANDAASHPDYNRDVRPVLAENCFPCHGADSGRRQAGLRLDKQETATAKLPSGLIAIVRGKPSASEMVDRITAHDGGAMPPADSNKRLTGPQIALLTRWIQEGAHYAPHWAYIRPVRPALPVVKRAGDHPGSIDRFLLARLERENILPSPAADARTLIRRLSLDLTGLPPTPRETEAFLRDQRPGAYERAVDRLLASPHYGERMAVYWLDLVRYADTVGYHGDQDVSVWPYRDYVIGAFNSGKRFDQFTREQLAGDLLPNASIETRVASAYNRLGEMTAEGGAQDKEYRAKYAADRVRNLSAAWLGSTMGCAECHDHKYDPFTQKDFYQCQAFFADLTEKGFYPGGGEGGDWGPSLRLLSNAQKAQLATFEAEIAAAKKTFEATPDRALADGRSRWAAAALARDAAKTSCWTAAMPEQATSSGGATLTIGKDASVLASGKFPAFDTYTATIPASVNSISSLRLEVMPDGSLPGNGIARAGTHFVLSEIEVAVQRAGVTTPVRPAGVVVDAESDGFPGIALVDGRADTGWAQIYGGARNAVLRFAEPICGGPGVKLIVRLRQETSPHLEIGKFRLWLSSLPLVGPQAQGMPDDVLAALREPEKERDPKQTAAIASAYREAAPELEPIRRCLANLEGLRSLLIGGVPETLVSVATEPRPIRVLPRGNWMNETGEIVQPGVPHFLRQIARHGRATRLDLANWVTASDNPLTARVLVNRLWKLFFGGGLAKNLDDFGAQADAPEHPELLDWLATELIASGWDVKHMVRLIVDSVAYRRSSVVRPDLAARDPYNRLFARQSAIRLDAEFIRDQALAVSGLLSPRIGGPSAHPYEPRAYLAALNFPHREWATDTGEDLYRRAMYTHWQRTFLHPSLLAFDAPTREEATCTRSVSNTPMQALVLLNDPIFVECARALAARALSEGGGTFTTRLDFIYRTVLIREPLPKETAILRRLYFRQRARFTADRRAAAALTAVGESPVPTELDRVELAAWTSVARTLLSLHETITRS